MSVSFSEICYWSGSGEHYWLSKINLHTTALCQMILLLSLRPSLSATEQWQEAVEVEELKELFFFFLQGHSLAWQQAKQDKLTQHHKRHKERGSGFHLPRRPQTALSFTGSFWLNPVCCLFLIHPSSTAVAGQKKTLQRDAHANVNGWQWSVCLFWPVWFDKREINSKRLVEAGSNTEKHPFLALMAAFEIRLFQPANHWAVLHVGL